MWRLGMFLPGNHSFSESGGSCVVTMQGLELIVLLVFVRPMTRVFDIYISSRYSFPEELSLRYHVCFIIDVHISLSIQRTFGPRPIEKIQLYWKNNAIKLMVSADTVHRLTTHIPRGAATAQLPSACSHPSVPPHALPLSWPPCHSCTANDAASKHNLTHFAAAIPGNSVPVNIHFLPQAPAKIPEGHAAGGL